MKKGSRKVETNPKSGRLAQRPKAPRSSNLTPNDGAANSRVIETHLAKLESENLIRPLPDEVDLSFIFKHALTQEATYDSLLKSKRADLHRQVAEVIEKLAPNEREQHAAVLAMHYDRGGWDDLAFIYAALAGDVAWRSYSHKEALTHYDLALAVAKRLDSDLLNSRVREVYVKRGRVFEVIGNHDAARQNYEEMIEFAQRAKDAAMEADGLNHLVTIQGVSGVQATDKTFALLDRALELARSSGEKRLVGQTLWTRGFAHRFGDPVRAGEYFRQSLELARAEELKELEAFSLTELTIQSQSMAQWRAALDYATQALEAFRALDNTPMVIDSLANVAELRYVRGEVALARKAAQEGVHLSQQMENPWGLVFSSTILMGMDMEAGEFDQVLKEGEKLLPQARTIGFPPFVGLVIWWFLRAHLELNQLDQAQKLAGEAMRALEKMGTPAWMTLGAGMRALVLVRKGMLQDAHAMLEPLWHEGAEIGRDSLGFMSAGIAIAELAHAQARYQFGIAFCDQFIRLYEEQKAINLACDLLYQRGRMHHLLGDFESAERDLTRAREYAVRLVKNSLLWQIDAALAELWRKDASRAKAAQQTATETIRKLANTISDPERRASFLSRPEVVRVLE